MLGVALLLGASLRFGHICATCGLTYVLTLVYAGACAGSRCAERCRAGSCAERGSRRAVLALAFALLLLPGLRTPQNPSTSGARAIGDGARLPSTSSDDQELARLVREAPEQVRQLMSDMLADYAAQPVWSRRRRAR